MANALLVHVSHTSENLSHVVADSLHRDISFVFFGLLDLLLEVRVTVFKNQILHDFSFLISCVKNVKHLDYVLAALKSVEHLKLTADILTGL